ncbi:DUF3667 domain-containing protein [uncultured Erythrobacter sp.]|uniref:DUF3667 domain-containing protein n=1 Tax=uncultured Erythrobacter sp. TaxID=263913 RepID=UPI002617299F|nr:DUF3667 domain-containing protein [uncultured Erythrobacter sp.]
MSDVTEGIGGAIEGALAGRAVEPAHGEGSGHSADPTACSNCGATVTATYCPDCGQKRHIHRTISAIMHDLIHGVLHLDGKLWHTLPLLVFKPGKLTRRYIDGERAKFVSPMAMFLFSVFAMFAVFQAVGLTAPTDLVGDTRAQVTDMVEAESRVVTAQIAEVDKELAKPDLDEARRAELETRREGLESDLALLETRGQNLTRMLASGETELFGDLEAAGEDQLSAAKARLETLPEGSSERANLAAEIASAEDGITRLQQLGDANLFVTTEDGSLKVSETGVGFLDSLLDKWNKNPSLMLYKLQANGYKFSWLLIPLSIPFVWLTFAWRRRFKAYDHAIFVTYSLSFMSLLFIVISLLAASSLDGTGGWAFTIFATVAPLHVYKHLKHTYDLSRFSTIWRFLVLLVCIIIILVLFLQALLVLGAF